MSVLYNLGILLYSLAASVISLFDHRARLWHEGRKGWEARVKEKISPGDEVYWVHCASLGEFEQGRPVIEEIRRLHPGCRIVLTFFSPSGFEVRKNYPVADLICYLPADTPGNAGKFISLVNPAKVIFVKYEFWNNYISELYRRRIPLYLISGIFRDNQHFFSWYGSFFRKMLRKFEMIFVQDEASLRLLERIGISKAAISGDTRFDRVVQIAGQAAGISKLKSFAGGEKLFLAGSSWAPDEEIMAKYINGNPEKMKWVFAPHEVHETNITRLEALFTVPSVRFSEFDEGRTDARVMIIDNIGMLSSAYRYATVAAVGGGFGKGIHNVLEPACWGIPVLFGPRHEKFREALDLIKEKGGMSYDSFGSFSEILEKLLSDESFYLETANAAGSYVKKNTGATQMIIRHIFDK